MVESARKQSRVKEMMWSSWSDHNFSDRQIKANVRCFCVHCLWCFTISNSSSSSSISHLRSQSNTSLWLHGCVRMPALKGALTVACVVSVYEINTSFNLSTKCIKFDFRWMTWKSLRYCAHTTWLWCFKAHHWKWTMNCTHKHKIEWQPAIVLQNEFTIGFEKPWKIIRCVLFDLERRKTTAKQTGVCHSVHWKECEISFVFFFFSFTFSSLFVTQFICSVSSMLCFIFCFFNLIYLNDTQLSFGIFLFFSLYSHFSSFFFLAILTDNLQRAKIFLS